MNLDLTRSLVMPFKGNGWPSKILIGTLIWIIASVFAFSIPTYGSLLQTLILTLATGYSLTIMRQESVASSDNLPTTAPEWSDWQSLFKNGLLLMLIHIIYGLLLMLVILAVTLMLGAGAAISSVIASGVVPGAAVGLLLSWVVVVVLLCVIPFWLYMTVLSVHFAHEERFSAAFEVGTILRKTFSNIGNVFLALIGTLMMAFAVVLLSVLSGGYLVPLGAFVLQMVSASLWGQVYRLAA